MHMSAYNVFFTNLQFFYTWPKHKNIYCINRFLRVIVAISVVQEEEHFVNKRRVTVLPYYTELGVAVNKEGGLPKYDISPHIVNLSEDEIRREKIRYFITFDLNLPKHKNPFFDFC